MIGLTKEVKRKFLSPFEPYVTRTRERKVVRTPPIYPSVALVQAHCAPNRPLFLFGTAYEAKISYSFRKFQVYYFRYPEKHDL